MDEHPLVGRHKGSWHPCLLSAAEFSSLPLRRWAERGVTGDPPMDPHWRRNLDAILDGRRLIVVGACI